MGARGAGRLRERRGRAAGAGPATGAGSATIGEVGGDGTAGATGGEGGVDQDGDKVRVGAGAGAIRAVGIPRQVTGATGATLDAGALIALEAGSPYMREIVRVAFAERAPLAIPAGVLAQVWRASARQARVARLLGSPLVEVVPLDRSAAVAVGRLCAETGARDVVDVSVVVCARQRRHAVLTSDPGDLQRIGPELRLLDPVTGR